LLDTAGRQQKEREIRDKQQEAATRQQELNVELDRRRAELLEPIVVRVNEVIEEIRAERGYSIVLDIAAGVVAADTSLDITTSVLERLGVDLAAISAQPGG
jgi:Skp family chaperone for outer membrane proteins